MKKVIILCVTIAIGISLYGCVSSSDYQRLYEEAEEQSWKRDYDSAINSYSIAIEGCPDKAEAYLGRGNAYIKQEENYKNLTLAIKDYKEALELEPDNVETYVAIIDAYIRSNVYDVAETMLLEALQKFNDKRIDNWISQFQGNSGISWIRDIDDNLRKVSGYDEDGKLQWYHVYKYVNNKQSEAILYDAEGVQKQAFSFKYDDNGNQLQSFTYTTNGPAGLLNQTYDEENRIITSVSTNLEGTIEYKETYSYGDKLAKSVRREDYVDGIISGSSLLEYDEQNRFIQGVYFDANGETTGYQTWEYLQNKDIRTSYNADDTIEFREVTEYDENHKKVKYIVYDANGEIKSEEEY